MSLTSVVSSVNRAKDQIKKQIDTQQVSQSKKDNWYDGFLFENTWIKGVSFMFALVVAILIIRKFW